MKTSIALCHMLLFFLQAGAQTGLPVSEEIRRIGVLRDFCAYLQQTPESDWAKARLQSYVRTSDSAWVEGTRQHQVQQAALKALGRGLQGLDLARHDAVPWEKFSRQDKLPKMAWESEPVGEVAGRAVAACNRAKELAEGRRQLINTLVVFKKDEPDVPLYCILFDEPTGRIASWVLVNQGGLHYFLFL